MDAFKIVGGKSLTGVLTVSGSKNASLPIMAAALLAEGESILWNTPDLADVSILIRVLEHAGAHCTLKNGTLSINARKLTCAEAPYDLVRTMRASFLVLAPLVARFGRARVSLPGGCAIGARPVDLHLMALEKLGAQITIEHGYVEAHAPNGFIGNTIHFSTPSVGATEHAMIAAACARGTTDIHNAAREPEIEDLAKALQSMGADVEGVGTSQIRIQGSSSLKPFHHKVIPDRIEAGTFLIAGALAGEQLVVQGCPLEHHTALLETLHTAGVDVSHHNGETITLNRCREPEPLYMATAPYPGFPTDTQAQMTAFLSIARGRSVITETIFENRFMHAPELCRMGAHIRIDGGKAYIDGVPSLSGATVMATDLRASASLLLAALIAEGTTIVRRIYHLDRGYEKLETKFSAVGANMIRFSESVL